MKTVAPAPTAARTLEERTQAIVAMVRTQGFQTIEALSVRFQVTPQTIRRDVNLLCESGLLRRRHGGVDSPLAGNNLSYRERQVLNIEAKRAIARRVAEDVPQKASVFFGIGTTPEQCAQALAGHAALKAMTNNLNVAMILRANPDCEITIAGGRIRNADGDVIAGEAHGFFARYSVDIGIFGVGGVAEDGTLLDFNPDEVAMRQTLMAHCRRSFLVLDHSKFGRPATVRGGHIADAGVIYTDRPVPDAIATLLAAAGTPVVVAGDGQDFPQRR